MELITSFMEPARYFQDTGQRNFYAIRRTMVGR